MRIIVIGWIGDTTVTLDTKSSAELHIESYVLYVDIDEGSVDITLELPCRTQVRFRFPELETANSHPTVIREDGETEIERDYTWCVDDTTVEVSRHVPRGLYQRSKTSRRTILISDNNTEDTIVDIGFSCLY